MSIWVSPDLMWPCHCSTLEILLLKPQTADSQNVKWTARRGGITNCRFWFESILNYLSSVVTICTSCCKIQKIYVLSTQCVYVLCVDLRINSGYFTVQHWLVGFYNWDGVCLLRGTFYSLRSAHTVYLRVLCGSENKQRLFHCTALTAWFL